MGMSIKRFTGEEALRLTKVRKGEVKVGERIYTQTSEGLRSLDTFRDKGVRFCLLGIPECIGVMGNNGNPGAENGWKAFITNFLNIQSNRFLSGSEFLVLGEVEVSDLQKQAIESDKTSTDFTQKMHELCERLDLLISPVIRTVIEAGLVPIVIGGGHNNAYPILKGASQSLENERGIHCINLDAHADYRALEGRHSGNGFSYAKNDGFLDKYFAFGLHQSYNGEHMLKVLDSTDNVNYCFIEDMENPRQDLNNALKFVHDENVPCGIELDMDAIGMMPSSAISPTGFSLEQARAFVRSSVEMLDVAYLHLPEAAPLNDVESRIVGKALVYLVADFAKAVIKKAQS